jgi:hypothetical protein
MGFWGFGESSLLSSFIDTLHCLLVDKCLADRQHTMQTTRCDVESECAWHNTKKMPLHKPGSKTSI